MTLPYAPVPDEKLKQIIDAQQLYASYRAARTEAERYRARLSWQKVGKVEYLVSTRHDRGLRVKKSLGPRSGATEALYTAHSAQLQASTERYDELARKMERQVRLNRALRLGSVPAPVTQTLEQLENAGLGRKIITIGTNAMYAYATAASVSFDEPITATQDLDLLWDSRSKLKIASPDPKGLLGLIQKGDPSFGRMEGKVYTIMNKDGYQVDLIKRDEGFQGSEPGQVWSNEDDFWAVKVRNMDWLLSAPKFEQVVISSSGGMATMTTVDPRAFGLFKVWLSDQPDRDAAKRRRDLAQAKAVFALVEEWLPQLSLDDIKPIPERVRARARDI
jgi:hypothetical protein